MGQGHAAQQALRWPTGLVNVPPGQSAFPGPDQYAALGQPERNLGFLGTLRRDEIVPAVRPHVLASRERVKPAVPVFAFDFAEHRCHQRDRFLRIE